MPDELMETYLRDNHDGTLTFMKVIISRDTRGDTTGLAEEEGCTVRMPWLTNPKLSKNPTLWSRFRTMLVKTN